MWPALTLPSTICHIPHYKQRIGTAPALISLSYTPTAFSAPFPEPQWFPSSSPSHIYISYLHAKHLSHNTQAEQLKSNSRIGSLNSLYSAHPCEPVSFNFSLCSFFFLPYSQNIVSHLICVPSAPQCPIYSMFNSLSTSSNSESLGFASMSSTCTRLAAGVYEWEWILSPNILIAISWLAIWATAHLLVWL